MLDVRSPLIVGAAPAGLLLAAGIWCLFGGPSATARPLADLQERLGKVSTAARAPIGLRGDPVADALANPIFPLTTGPKAVKDPTVALQGVARSPGRAAALISIDGAKADWLQRGETRDGVTLVEVQSGRIVIDTPTGRKDVSLGQSVGPQPGAAGQTPAPSAGP